MCLFSVATCTSHVRHNANYIPYAQIRFDLYVRESLASLSIGLYRENAIAIESEGLYRENSIAIESEAKERLVVMCTTSQCKFRCPFRNLHCDVVHTKRLYLLRDDVSA